MAAFLSIVGEILKRLTMSKSPKKKKHAMDDDDMDADLVSRPSEGAEKLDAFDEEEGSEEGDEEDGAFFWGVRGATVPNLVKTTVPRARSPRALGVGALRAGNLPTGNQKAEMLVCYMPLDNSASAARAFGTSVRCNQL